MHPYAALARPPRQDDNLPGQERCSADSYVILPHKSKYVDQQTLKLQARLHACARTSRCWRRERPGTD